MGIEEKDKNMDYGKILNRAWQVIWKYKILWLFGILASCGNNANSGSSGANGSPVNYRFDGNNPPDNLPPEMYRFFHNLGDFFERTSYQWGIWLSILILVIFVLIFVTFVIRVYGQVGLVRGVFNADKNQPEKLTFSEISAEIKPFYWRLFGFQLLLFVVFFVLIGLIALVVIAGTAFTFGIGLLCFLPLVCVLIPVGWVVAVVIKQAVIAMLIDDLTIGDSLRRGWEVVRSRAVDYLAMGLILFIGGWIITIIFSLPQLFALAPLISSVIQGAWTDDWYNILNGIWITVACLVAYWPVLVLLRGVLNSFTESAWVLTYLEATREDRETDDPELLEPELEST
jgi:hypothetical protein